MSLIVDAHQHFWTCGTYQTSWMEAPPYAGDPAFEPLRRSFEPGDLLPELEAAGIDLTVAVVANLRGGYCKVWRETNRALARLSRDERDRILGGTAIAFYRLPIETRSP